MDQPVRPLFWIKQWHKTLLHFQWTVLQNILDQPVRQAHVLISTVLRGWLRLNLTSKYSWNMWIQLVVPLTKRQVYCKRTMAPCAPCFLGELNRSTTDVGGKLILFKRLFPHFAIRMIHFTLIGQKVRYKYSSSIHHSISRYTVNINQTHWVLLIFEGSRQLHTLSVSLFHILASVTN